MSGFKRIPLEIKEQVLTRAKEGIPVAQLSNEHGISTKAIYAPSQNTTGLPVDECDTRNLQVFTLVYLVLRRMSYHALARGAP